MQAASLRSKIPDTVTTFCVGSLPFKDADSAVEFVRSQPWILPFWPELPQKDAAEFMVPRSDRALQSAWHGYSANEAAGLFALIKTLESSHAVVPIVKGQLLGPLSHAFFSEELEGDFSTKLRAASVACMRQIEWQISALAKISPAVLLVLDEPGFVHWDKLAALEKDLVREQLTYLYVSAGERNCYLGIHSCAQLQSDFYSLPADLLSVDALLDAGQGLVAAKAGAKPVIAAGVVPASPSKEFEIEIAQGAKLYSSLRTGLPTGTRMLFSANCGHGLASESWVRFLYQEARNALPTK